MPLERGDRRQAVQSPANLLEPIDGCRLPLLVRAPGRQGLAGDHQGFASGTVDDGSSPAPGPGPPPDTIATTAATHAAPPTSCCFIEPWIPTPVFRWGSNAISIFICSTPS